MKRKFFLLIILILPTVLFSSLSASSRTPTADTRASIHLRGSGAVMSLAQYSAEAYMEDNPGMIVSVSGGGTSRGIKSLIDGTSQIAMASSEINKELLMLAEEKNVTLIKHVVAYDAIVPFVNLKNPISDLTMEQLRKIYTSQIVDWKEVNGNKSPIAITTRNFSSGTYEGWKLLVIGEKAIISPNAIPMESRPMKEFIIKNPGAIGYSAFSYIDNTVKQLAVNSILASAETIKSGKYPLKRDLILYTRNDASAETLKFVEYIKEIAPNFAESIGIFPLDN